MSVELIEGDCVSRHSSAARADALHRGTSRMKEDIERLRGDGLSFSQIAAKLGTTRSVVAGVLHRKRHPKPRVGHPTTDPRGRNYAVHRGHMRLVKWLAEEIPLQSRFYDDVFDEAGLSKSVFHHWRAGRVPNIANFEAVVNALGYRLTVEPLDETKRSTCDCPMCLMDGA